MKSQVMRLLFRSIILDKQQEYNIVQASNLEWTVVRVPFIELTDNHKDIQSSLEDCKGSGISSADLARFLVSQIDDVRFLKKAPFIWNS